MEALRRRALGVAFFVVVALFFALTILKFNNFFADDVDIKLTTDSAGSALPKNADVKVRGVIVGRVTGVDATINGPVTVKIALNSGDAKRIPANVTARILPKTLFGERYVALQLPATADSRTLHGGATIATDASKNALELQQLFDNLLPVLQAIPPQDLNSTLGALATMLSGNGQKIHDTIGRLDTVFTGINRNSQALTGTIKGLASFSATYSQALPDLINALDNFRTTSNTLVERKGDLANVVTDLTGTAQKATNFLDINGQPLVDLTVGSRKILQMLAKHSAAFPCTFKGFANAVPGSAVITGVGQPNPGTRVSVQIANPRGRYLPNQDEPRFLEDRDPICYQVATNGRPLPQYPGGSFNDGSYQVPSRNPGPQTLPTMPQPDTSVPARNNSYPGASDARHGAQTVAFNPVARSQAQIILGAYNNIDAEQVPAWMALLASPAFAGRVVSIS